RSARARWSAHAGYESHIARGGISARVRDDPAARDHLGARDGVVRHENCFLKRISGVGTMGQMQFNGAGSVALAIATGLFGLAVSLFWMWVGWRARRAHERIADALQDTGQPPATP